MNTQGSPYFQRFFDIIFQEQIIIIIQRHLLAQPFHFHKFPCSPLGFFEILSSPLRIQNVVMLMKYYITDAPVPETLKTTLRNLHHYVFMSFLCTSPSHELQPLHLFYTQNLRLSFEYIDSQSYTPAKQVTKSESQVSV